MGVVCVASLCLLDRPLSLENCFGCRLVRVLQLCMLQLCDVLLHDLEDVTQGRRQRHHPQSVIRSLAHASEDVNIVSTLGLFSPTVFFFFV